MSRWDTLQSTNFRSACAALLLLGVVLSGTSRFPISPVVLVFAVIAVIPLSGRPRGVYDTLTLKVFLLFGYCILSALISGVPPGEFFNYDLYRYDGNMLVSWLPFLLCAQLRAHDLPLESALKITVTACALSTSLIELVIPGTLFISHNAFGGFLSIVILINLYLMRSWYMAVPLALNLAAMATSDSRGSLLGIALAGAAVILYQAANKLWIKLFAAVMVSVQVLVLVAGYAVWDHIGQPEILGIQEFSDISESSLLSGQSEIIGINNIGARGATVSHRLFFIWPVAVSNFFSSPLVGIGFTRFDDRPTEFHGIPGIVLLNESPHIEHTDLHAHNSFLQFAAETGIIGLGLVVSILVTIWRRLSALVSPFRQMGQTVLLYAIFSSLTEHRLTTPAQALPMSFLLVVLVTSLDAQPIAAAFARTRAAVAS